MNTELHDWACSVVAAHPESIESLRPEASFRSFFRLGFADGTSIIAMDAPPEREDADRFVRLASLLRAGGVPVPAIREADLRRGFVLMEDLGRTHFIDAYRSGDAGPALDLAIDMLPVLQRLPADALPPYTEARLIDELGIFTTWFVEKALGESIHDAWPAFSRALVDAVMAQPFAAVHRDYHCKNLLLNDGKLGIVDFQDALTGPALYDLASLLRDCYWAFDESTVRAKLTRYLAATPLHFEEPLLLLNLTALQRQIKAIGIFARLCLRDSKPSHIDYIDSVLAQSTSLAESWRGQRPGAEPGDGVLGLEIAAWLRDLRRCWSTRQAKLPVPEQ